MGVGRVAAYKLDLSSCAHLLLVHLIGKNETSKPMSQVLWVMDLLRSALEAQTPAKDDGLGRAKHKRSAYVVVAVRSNKVDMLIRWWMNLKV